LDQDNIKKILHDRAVALAREYASGGDDTEGIDVTVFRLGRELYALESRLIREIVLLKGFTPLPCVPPFIAGIMNLRGRILSLLDLHRLFELPGETRGDDGKVVVLSGDGMEFGIIVAKIEGVRRIIASTLQEDFSTLRVLDKKYLRGVTLERLILLDGLKLLNDPALIINENIS